VRVAVLSSLGEGAGEVLKELASDASFVESKEGREMLASVAAQIGRQQRPDDVKETLVALRALTAANSPTLPTIIQRLGAKSGTPLAEQIAVATGGKAEVLMKSLLVAAAKRATDEAAPAKARAAAVEQLRLGSFAESKDLLASLLSPAVAAELQAAALSTLASFDAEQAADVVLSQFAGLSPRLKGQATDLLLSRPAWTGSLLSVLESGQLPIGDVDPAKLKLLAEHRNSTIRTRANKLLVNNKLGRRSEVVDAYRGVLEMKGSPERGKQIFTKTCAACHKVGMVGNDIGPNLASMKARGPEAILLNVLDPNREVNPQYLNYAVMTADGRQLTGLIAAETATSITLKRADNATDTVLRIDIEQLKSTGMSLMPEGMEKQIDPTAMADLLQFLMAAE